MKTTPLQLFFALLLVFGTLGCDGDGAANTDAPPSDDGPGHTADINANTGEPAGHEATGEGKGEEGEMTEEGGEGTTPPADDGTATESEPSASAVGPFDDHQAMIAAAIDLLEKKDYETLMHAIISPDEIAQLPSTDVFVNGFGNSDKPAELLTALKSIKGANPSISPDGNEATFALPEPVGTKTDLTLVKVDGHWYLSN